MANFYEFEQILSEARKSRVVPARSGGRSSKIVGYKTARWNSEPKKDVDDQVSKRIRGKSSQSKAPPSTKKEKAPPRKVTLGDIMDRVAQRVMAQGKPEGVSDQEWERVKNQYQRHKEEDGR